MEWLIEIAGMGNMTELLPRAEVRITPLPPPDDTPPNHAAYASAETALKLSVVDLKRELFQRLREHLEGGQKAYDLSRLGITATNEPGEITAKASSPEAGIAPPLSPRWDRVVLISFSEPMRRGHGFMPPAEITDADERQDWISAKLHDAWPDKPKYIDTMQAMTRDAAVVRINRTTHPLIPRYLLDSYKTMDKPAREAFLLEWFSWSKHGDGFTTPEDESETPLRFLPGDDASLTLTEGNKQFRAAIVFDVSPLCIDLDLNLVNYLVRVGLPWEGDMGDPSTWPTATRKTLWQALFASFDAQHEFFRGKSPRLPDAVHSTSGQLTETFRPENAEPTPQWVAKKIRIIPLAETADAARSTTIETSGSKPIFPAAFGAVRVDRDVQAILRGAGRLKLPRQWSRIPRWERLKADELERLLAMGPAAYEDTDERPALLEKERIPGVQQRDWPTQLTAYAEDALRERAGVTGYIATGPNGTERLVKCVRQGANLISAELSWYGKAGPLIDDWRKLERDDIAETRARREAERRPLLDAMGNDPRSLEDFEQLKRLDKAENALTLYDRGQRAMEVILGQAAKQKRLGVELHSEVFRRLFWPEGNFPRDWKQDVENVLRSLRYIEVTASRDGMKVIAGSFFTSFQISALDTHAFSYIPRGRGGGHGEGIYQVRLNPDFLGCLTVFLDGERPLRGGGSTVLLNFAKELSKDERKKLKYARIDAGTAFYSATAQLTNYQHNLSTFIDGNITMKSAPIAGGMKGGRGRFKVSEDDSEATTPRTYDTGFCPLLPAGTTYVAALGNFRRSAETGFTLYGTERSARADGKAGALPGGIIEKMGYAVPSGNAHDRRGDILANVIDDLRRVVVVEYGGVVVGKLTAKDRTDGGTGELWLPLEDWLELDDRTLARRLKVHIFLPHDWREKRILTFEDRTGYRVTHSADVAAAAAWGEPPAQPLAPGEICNASSGWRGLSLPQRLRAAMKHRGLNQTDVAQIFGVTQGAVSRWVAAARGETDPSKAVRVIPEDMARMLIRWIETGEPPSKAELEARPSIGRRPSRRPIL